MKDIQVRAESPDDFRAIDVVNLSAFEGDSEARLVSELRKHEDYSAELSFVAEFNGRLVGHCMLTPSQLKTDKGSVDVLLLAPMSVVPSQSHRGIGRELVDAAIKIAKLKGFSAIIASGKPDYYSKLGFEQGTDRCVECDLPIPDDAVMLIELEKGALSKGGKVSYGEPFLSLYGVITTTR